MQTGELGNIHKSKKNTKADSWKNISICPICHSAKEKHSFFEDFLDHGFELSYKICHVCGLVFQSPRLKDAALEEFYESEYRRTVQGQEGPLEKDIRVQSGRAINILAQIKDEIGPVISMLDIGSSTGILLRLFREQLGFNVIGVEPGQAYRDYSLQQGIPTYEDLESIPEAQDRFELISLLHVLEHVPNPVDYLVDLRKKWLNDRGTLLIEVPYLYGHQSLELSHLFAFTKATLSNILSRSGYEVIKIRTHGDPRSAVIPLYLLVLARPARGLVHQPSKTRVSMIQLRRRLGNIYRRVMTKFLPFLSWKPLPDWLFEHNKMLE